MVLGHDRGARVAYRLALDHPSRVSRLGIIEIAPTGDYWANWGAELAMAAYHWTFLAQPAPLPERMIGADPVAYIDHTLQSWTLTGDSGEHRLICMSAFTGNNNDEDEADDDA